MLSLVSQGWRFFRTHTLHETFTAILSRDAHPLIQFAKYGFCGVLALGAQTALWLFFSQWWPSSRDLGLDQATRAYNHWMANLLAFPLGNFIAFFTNRLFVFTPGRHSLAKEFWLFTGISLFSFCVGLAAGPLMIYKYGIHQGLAQGGLAVTSALVNFVCRKFLVFAK